jgi:chromate transporter
MHEPAHESYPRLFLRFLRFGCLAWGGPVAQIDMIRQELVTEKKWVTPDHFKKLLAVYQVLPGPEAHELCVHFGMLARGRIGGILAGLGFMLPGFLLMFLFSWLYLRMNLTATAFQAVFLGIQPAVIALIVRACHRIGTHCVTNAPLLAIALLAAAADWVGISFYITLPVGGILYAATTSRPRLVWPAVAVAAIALGACWMAIDRTSSSAPNEMHAPAAAAAVPEKDRGAGELFVSGLRAGLLTFGGAYTAIPFLRDDAVRRGAWMTEAEFLDGVALGGILPAPLIIFSTFVGYSGGGPLGALAITLGVFLPAFGFSLIFFHRLERLTQHSRLRDFLDGVTAAVVGLIAATTIKLGLAAIPSLPSLAIFAGALVAVYLWKSKWSTPVIILGAGLAGSLVW